MRWKPGTSDAQKQAVREGLAALAAAIPEIRSYQFGDDATLVEELGMEVRLFEGSPRNLKVTTPDDLALVQALLRAT